MRTEECQPGPWLKAMDGRRGDEAAAKKAVRRLYELIGQPVPEAVIWLDSPFAGLLADGYLHRTFFDSLFQGDAPALMEQMMQDYHHWQMSSCEGTYFPSPNWSSLQSGRRLSSRGKAAATGLQRRAGELAALQDMKSSKAFADGIVLTPGEKELALAVLGRVRKHLAGMPEAASMPEVNEFLKGLPWVLGELGRIPGHDALKFARTFNFNPQSGTYGRNTSFNLGAPRCINFDQVAAWLWLAQGVAEGWIQAQHIAQKYFRDGMVEDFSPWDDNSPPYPATQSFDEWVREGIDILAPAARLGKKKKGR